VITAGLQCLHRRECSDETPGSNYFLLKSDQERAEFLAAGVDLPRGKMMEGGEFIRFEIAEDDPRWESFARVLRERRDRALKNRTPPGEAKVSPSGNAEWLDGYSGQTVEELLSLEGRAEPILWS
jgi:hypothetical protein